jgi:hypothetical protein
LSNSYDFVGTFTVKHFSSFKIIYAGATSDRFGDLNSICVIECSIEIAPSAIPSMELLKTPMHFIPGCFGLTFATYHTGVLLPLILEEELEGAIVLV